jgi:hypothetical protein
MDINDGEENREGASDGSHEAVDGDSSQVNGFAKEETKTDKEAPNARKGNKEEGLQDLLGEQFGDEDEEEVMFDLNVTLDILQIP